MEDGDSAEEASPYQLYTLPNIQFKSLWSSLIYDDRIKSNLLQYLSTIVLFSKHDVDSNIVSHNKIVLLNGPPGTGKTSLCKALAQKISIRFNHIFHSSVLIEINSHSLFSKWFSESGKLVMKVFDRIRETAEDSECFVIVLIDEVESLTAARKAALSGAEPSDSIRVVNAFLTQLDRLKTYKNVIILTTSNLVGAVDIAFIDRVDIKQYIGLPSLQARAVIFRSCIDELIKKGLMKGGHQGHDQSLQEVAKLAEGLSGRSLRRIPFLTFSNMYSKSAQSVQYNEYMDAMKSTLALELANTSKIEKL
ncbi:hypothetical protein SAMD00019534_003660 [Acytostelium subglobosum LB1]|uniref:hypothetical protein n=1 Tax=Acytostelium subglobosum LB1 TaxID=1410327 RepID=UPI00064490FA|nr:hypothetical protein SAMD00019534_003660 [Acytostelium subglobosum LB1]GAM17191.1 hypothetical protein SAMD00019534_003660 [Acytostelium subglobosum LB1]|eukprot:XP_012759253.1 hypothetical protein SAMD00019534_003660 [Acytostelium subglobosum LB1]